MKSSAPSRQMIEVERLRVGMFVHLDMGWMAHPFPLGSFRIGSDEQIATIRSLGVPQVRWSPAQSDADLAAPPAGGAHGSDAAGDPPAMVALPSSPAATATATATATAPSAESLARQAHRRSLVEQRAALQRCERRFAEAARDLRQVTEAVAPRPQEARAGAERLATALIDKMLGEREVCIRLLTDAAGDKASAHALNVAVISLLMGRTFGLSGEDLLDLGVGALLHDIGKLDLPDRLRHLEEQFTPAELRGYEEHVAHGVAQGRRMGLAPGAALVIAQHHELADGGGFPLRLASDRLATGGRIVALVNRYDNLCNPHNPARALTPHESISLLFAQGKNKFDTAILGAFIRMMGVYPAGSTVQLTDDRYAMVMAVNSTRPLKPRVLVHDPRVPRDEALIVDLEATHGLGIRRSLKPAQLPAAALAYLAPRSRVACFFEGVDAPGEPEPVPAS